MTRHLYRAGGTPCKAEKASDRSCDAAHHIEGLPQCTNKKQVQNMCNSVASDQHIHLSSPPRPNAPHIIIAAPKCRDTGILRPIRVQCHTTAHLVETRYVASLHDRDAGCPTYSAASRAASMSGSLWYPGFKDFALTGRKGRKSRPGLQR